MKWWDDLWLNESFADWLGVKIMTQVYPDYKVNVNNLGGVQGLLSRDARPSTRPIRRPVHSPSDIFEDLGLAYGKGRQVLGMLEQWIGEDVFRRGVVNYINRYEWKNTEAADLFAALSTAAGIDVTPMLESFLDQSGYPMITAELSEDGVLRLSQKRFLNEGVEAPDRQWTVPVRVKYADDKGIHTKTVILDKPSVSIQLDGKVDWLLPDAGAYGYYRWRVPEIMLLRIASDPEGTLDERERAVLMANLKALLNSGNMHGDEYLQVLAAYATVPKPEIIDAVITELGSIRAAFVTEDLEEAFAYYVRQTLQPALDAVGLQPREREEPTVTTLRPQIVGWLGRSGRMPEIRAHCKALVQQYMEDPNSVDPSLARVALRVVAQNGTAEDFATYQAKFEAADTPSERGAYLTAISSFEDTEILEKVLMYALTEAVRPNELFRIPGSAARTDAGRDIVYEWVVENYDAITSRIPPDFASFLPFMASGCSVERLQAARAFFGEESHQVGGTLKNLTKVGEQVSDCVNLRERDGARVERFLRELVTAP